MFSRQCYGVLFNMQSSVAANSIFNCIQTGDLEQLTHLVQQQHYSLDILTADGFDPVCYAVKHGQLAILIWLVTQQQCEIDTCVKPMDENNQPLVDKDPLELACLFEQVEIIKWLMQETGCGLDEYEKEAMLKDAVLKGQTELVQWLVKEQHIALNTSEDRHHNHLSLAADAGHLPLVKWLIEQENMLVRSGYEQRRYYSGFLHRMYRRGHLELVKWLELDKQHSIEEIGLGTLVVTSVHKGHLVLLQWLFDTKVKPHDLAEFRTGVYYYGSRVNIVLKALSSGHFTIAKWLVEKKGFSLAGNNKKGEDALLIACRTGPLVLVKWLVEEQNLSLAVQDSGNRTPLMYAVSCGHLDIARYLVDEHHCSLDVHSINGHYPIHYTILHNHLSVLQWLVDEQGCDMYRTRDHNEQKNILMLAFDRKMDLFAYGDNTALINWLCVEKTIFAHQSFRQTMYHYFQDTENRYFHQATYFWHALPECSDEAELHAWLQVFDAKWQAAPEKRNDRLDTRGYLLAIDTCLAKQKPFTEQLIQHYCAINKHSLDHITLLLRFERFTDVIHELTIIFNQANEHYSGSILASLTEHRAIVRFVLASTSLREMMHSYLQSAQSFSFNRSIWTFLEQCESYDEASYLIDLFQARISRSFEPNQNRFWEFSKYEKIIEQFAANDAVFVDLFIEHYCLISKQFLKNPLIPIDLLIRLDKLEPALSVLHQSINDHSVAEKQRINAKITYAEIMLVLSDNQDATPTMPTTPHYPASQSLLDRALFAYYLLCDLALITNPIVSRLKARLHNILSGNGSVLCLDASEATWLPEVSVRFQQLMKQSATPMPVLVDYQARLHGLFFRYVSDEANVDAERVDELVGNRLL